MLKKDVILNEHEFKDIKLTNIKVKEETKKGVKVGIIEGYGATWDLDRGDDIIIKGAFAKTLQRHKENNRPIRMLFGHDRNNLIGAFPIESAREDEKGLFLRGEINLETQQGREAFALAKQKVLTDMSIGFSIPSREAVSFEEVDDRVVRVLKEIELWEVSLVSEPMNPHATITDVKGVVPFKDLPLAARGRAWDGDGAVQRVRSFTNSDESPSTSYRNAFLWFDSSAPDDFGSYKLPIADVVDGQMRAVPRGIFAAAAAMRGARGGVDLPENARAGIIGNLERYYSKMDLDSPFKEKGIDVTMVEACETVSDVEQLLKFADFSSSASKAVIRILKGSGDREGSAGLDDDREGDDQSLIDDLAAKLKGSNAKVTQNLLLSKFKTGE